MPERESFRTVVALGTSSGGWAFSGRYHCRACKRYPEHYHSRHSTLPQYTATNGNSSKNARESQTTVKSMMIVTIKSNADFASSFPLLLRTSIETRPPYHLYLSTHNHYFSILRQLSPSQAAKPSQCPQFSRKLPLHTPG